MVPEVTDKSWRAILWERLTAVVATMDHLSEDQKALVLAEEYKAAVASTEAATAFGAPIPEDSRTVPPPVDEFMAAHARVDQLRRANIVPLSQQNGGKAPRARGIVSVGGKDPIITWIQRRFRTLLNRWRAPKRN